MVKTLISAILFLSTSVLAQQINCLTPGQAGCSRDDFDRALQIQGQMQQQQQQYLLQQQQIQMQQLQIQEMKRANQIQQQILQEQQFNNMFQSIQPVR